MIKPSHKFATCRVKILMMNLGIFLGMLVVSSLTLALTDSPVKAVHPSSNPNLILLLDEESAELPAFQASHISIDPPAPTENDIIRITASGNWFNVCVPRYQSHQVIGNVIRIDTIASFAGVCIPIEGPTIWSFTIEVGPLPVGLYTIEVYILDPMLGPILYDTTSFLVSTERLYLPIILRHH